MGSTPTMIVGVGRSGTSLVQSMLAAHSELAFPPETSFFRRFITTGVLERALNWDGEHECVAILENDRNLRRTGIRGRDVVQNVTESELSPRALYLSFLELYAKRKNKPRCGDKDPRLVEHLPLIWKAFPHAYVIHVLRDPRDVLASKKKAAWSMDRGVLRHIFANRVQFKIGLFSGKGRLRGQYQELVYEDLLDNPERELKKLCAAIDLRFEPAMLSFSDAARDLVSEEEFSWKRETMGPLLSNNRDKWKTDLSDWEVALTELACSSQFKRGRYALSGKFRELTPLTKLSLYVAWLVLIVLDPIYRSYRTYTNWRARKYL